MGSKHKDKIPGGLADNKKPSDFVKRKLEEGIKVEMEHTSDKAIAREIAMDHITEDPNYYKKLKTIEKSENEDLEYYLDKGEFVKNFKKSYDFRDVQVAISSADQAAAENSADVGLVNHIRSFCKSSEGDITKIPFKNGVLTLTKKTEGLYNGFFSDTDGTIVDKYDDKTVELIAKDMMMKNVTADDYATPTPEPELISESEEREEKPTESKPMHLKLRIGDFELELRKSVSEFVKSHKLLKKSQNHSNKDLNCKKSKLINKALRSWYKIMKSRQGARNELDSAKLLIKSWDQYKEEFMQTVHAIEQMYSVMDKVRKKK